MITEKKRQVKGSVLFTVVCVMSILIIFLMGTLVLAASANNRAHKSYSSSQTEYTARAAIESFTAAMVEQPDIVGAIQNLAPGGTPLEPEIILNDPSMGRIGYFKADNTFVSNKILVECLPSSENQYYYKNDGDWAELNTVKITASARLGGEDSTIVAYIRKKAPNEVTQSEIKGLQTVGGSTFTTTQGHMTGAIALGIASATPERFSFGNGSDFYTDLNFVNGDLDVAASVGIYVTNPKSETIIMGDVELANNKFVYLDYNMTSDFSQKEIPYLYIDGKLTVASSIELVKRTGMNTNGPYNVFVGSIDTWGNPLTIDGDLYIMGSTGLSRIGNSGSTALSAWTASVSQKGDTQFYSTGGNIYCKENLEISHTVVNGDLRVDGNLTIGANVTVYGNVVVSGNLDVTGNLNVLGAGHNVYVGGTTTGFGGTNSVKAGFEEKDNIYHPSEQITKSGFRCVDNIAYSYYKFVATVQNGSGYDGLFGENLGWSTTVGYYFKQGQYDPSIDYSTYSAEEMSLLIDTSRGTVAEWQIPAGYYMKVDVSGVETTELTSVASYYYEESNPAVERPVWEATETKPEYYTLVDYDGNDTGVEATPSNDPFSYFETATGYRVTAAEAMIVDGVFPLSMYGTDVYPSTMTREAINGDSGSATKIIQTLADVQEGLGYADGAFDESTYPTELPDHVTTSDWVSGDIDSSDSFVISKEINGTLNIKPSGNIWIVLDGDAGAKLGNDSKIIVDDSAGSVNFLIKGTVKMGNRALIITKEIYDRLNSGVKEIYERDTLGITYYSSTDGKLDLTEANQPTICGAAKAPTLEVLGKTTDGNPLFSGVQYTNLAGETVTYSTAHWVGNALIKGVSGYNNFTLMYTKTGGGGGRAIRTEAGTYVFSYFDQY